MSDRSPAAPPGPLDPAFLSLLCCPGCAERPPLQSDTERSLLRCPRCGQERPFAASGFPDLRPSEAAVGSRQSAVVVSIEY